jgi:hypothetical protein
LLAKQAATITSLAKENKKTRKQENKKTRKQENKKTRKQ